MSYKTYLIECDYLYSTGIVITALLEMDETFGAAYINENIVCVDTKSKFEDLYKYLVVDLDLTLGISELNYKNFNDMVSHYSSVTKGQIEDFMREVEISSDVNYFLDLIIDRGGVEHLNLKEKQRLTELSKK